MAHEAKSGDIVKVGGLEGYFRVISIEGLATARKFMLLSLKDNSIRSILSPPYQVVPVLTPIQMVKEGMFEPSERFDLFVEANRLSLTHLYDPLVSLSTTKIDVLPHQIEAVYKLVDAYEPNSLLADDAGLGKTIMAGMVIKELKLRGRAKRILVAVPAALQFQWHRELLEKFGEEFVIFNSEFIRSHYGVSPSVNPWQRHDRIITSMDFAKRDDVLRRLKEAEWDVVIVDEAHKLSARRFGLKEYPTERYKLAEAIKGKTKAILLLTATPHSGDSFAFYKLVGIVDPYLFASVEDLDREKLKRVMIRRLKEDIIDFDGKPLFPPREAKTIPVRFAEDEKTLYESVTDYVRYYFNLAKEVKNRGVSFAMTILQKRMASSIPAIKRSLENRLQRLREVLEKGQLIELTPEELELLEEYAESPEDVDEAALEQVQRKLDALTMAKNVDELKAEISHLEKLLTLAESITVDSKTQALLNFVKEVHKIDLTEKIVIFTEYRDTLHHLRERFQELGYKVAHIHGGMHFDDRLRQERVFLSQPDVPIMLGTDAISEGINLQFGPHIMVNYELPWNPNRMEQRIGRLHRYGQKKKVTVDNMLVEGTIEGAVFERLLEKLESIRREMGERVFDVLGILMSGVRLEDIIMEAITSRGVPEERIREAEEKIEERKKIILKDIEEKSLIKDKLDLAPLRELIGKSKEFSVDEVDIERFIRRFFLIYGGRIETTDRPSVYALELPKVLCEDGLYPILPAVTFSKEVAKNMIGSVEFVALGHPLLDRMLSICIAHEFGGRTTIKIDPKGKSGMLFAFRGRVITSSGEIRSEKLFTIFYDAETREFREVDPRSIWSFEDVEDPKSVLSKPSFMVDEVYGKAEELVAGLLGGLLEDTRRRVGRDVAIKREDVWKYYDRRIGESKRRIDEYRSKLPVKDMDIAIRREQARIRQLTEEMNDQLSRLEREEVLAYDGPELVAVALILPKESVEEVAPSKASSAIRKVEEAGMQHVMEYERSCGRKPLDVSQLFKGYDVLSEGVQERRYIEVKAFAETDVVEITSHEWLVAEKLKDEYWLYVVESALDPGRRRLYWIRNPSKTLMEVAECKPILQFKIVVDKWKELASVA